MADLLLLKIGTTRIRRSRRIRRRGRSMKKNRSKREEVALYSIESRMREA